MESVTFRMIHNEVHGIDHSWLARGGDGCKVSSGTVLFWFRLLGCVACNDILANRPCHLRPVISGRNGHVGLMVA